MVKGMITLREASNRWRSSCISKGQIGGGGIKRSDVCCLSAISFLDHVLRASSRPCLMRQSLRLRSGLLTLLADFKS